MNKIFKKSEFYFRVVILFLIFANLILIIKNFSFAYEAIAIGVSPLIALASIYDISNTFNLPTLVVTIISTILASISLVMLYEYLQIQKKVTGVKKLSVGLLLAILATHCASCGAAILGGLISITFLSALPFAGAEIGVLGSLVLAYTIFDLNKKLNNPYVC